MADEYIKRSDAIETLMQMCWHDEDGYPVEDAAEKRQYSEDWANAIPSADVVPVVRCKDCKYHATGADYADDFGEPLDKAMMCLGIRYGGVDPDWFCEHGERMDGGT